MDERATVDCSGVGGPLPENEKRFHALVRNALDIIMVTDADGTIQYISPSVERVLGYHPDEMVGTNAAEYVHPDDLEKGFSALAEALDKPGVHPVAVETRVRHKDGSWCHLEGMANNLLEDPAVRGVVFNHRDVTDRKRAEEEIRRLNENLEKQVAERTAQLEAALVERERTEEAWRSSKDQLEIILQGVTDGITAQDATGRLVYANEAAARLVGYPSAQALLEAPIQEVLQRFDITDEFGQPFPLTSLPGRRALQGEQSPETLLRFRQVESGEERWSVVNATPVFDERGRVRLAVNIFRDFTEHKQAEEEIRKLNEQLEQRVRRRTVQLETFNRELEAFSYSVSHDLRAPLRSIDGFSQILLEDHSEELDEDGKDCLQRVRAATQRMAHLIDDLLNLSRLTRSEMRHEKVDLSAMVEGLAKELEQAEPGRQVEFVIEEGLVVEGDRRLLRVALENLLRNAWKFTGKQPRARIEFGVSEHEDTPAYFVRDDGVGFDMAYAGKLFGAFQRLHSVNEFEGTGIGLATVQRIIHRHGGLVWAEGHVGHGATFYFIL